MPELIRVDPGPLTSISAFYRWSIKPLHMLTDLIREGHDIDIEWDLRSVEFQRINLGALTTFLSTAYRVRGFVSRTPLLLLTWNPRILGFLSDVSFFSIARDLDICKFQEEMLGGFDVGATNPNTGIMAFPFARPPAFDQETPRWQRWKDKQRMTYTLELLKRANNIFDSRNRKLGLPESAKNLVATSAAELILNSMLWGGSPAFVGMQRSSKRISVVVADSGQGFLHSIYSNRQKNDLPTIASHSDALVYASMINNRDFGLRKVINLIAENGGWVEMSSYSSELRWSYPAWDVVRTNFPLIVARELDLVDLIQRAFGDEAGNATREKKLQGYYRKWSRGIRGARVSFEYPLEV